MDDFLDDDIFADLDLVGIKRARALEAFAQLPDELGIRFAQGHDRVYWELDLKPQEIDNLNKLCQDAYPASALFHAGDTMGPWSRYSDAQIFWQRLYTAPSMELGLHSHEGSLAQIKQSRFFRVRPMSLDEYTKAVLDRAKQLQYNRPKVSGSGGQFDQLMMKMRQCIIILSGDPKLADVSQFGKRKVDAFHETHAKLRNLLGTNPLNVSVVEDAVDVARIVGNILNPNTREARAVQQLKFLGALRKEFTSTGTVRSVKP